MIALRHGTANDSEILLNFMQRYYEFDEILFNESVARLTLGTLLTDENLGVAYLIEEDSRAIGYIVLTFGFSLEFGGRYSFIDEFFIDAQLRGRGFGTETLRLLEAEARRHGVKAIHLEVELDNTEARDFYKSKGFEAPDRGLMYRRL